MLQGTWAGRQTGGQAAGQMGQLDKRRAAGQTDGPAVGQVGVTNGGQAAGQTDGLDR